MQFYRYENSESIKLRGIFELFCIHTIAKVLVQCQRTYTSQQSIYVIFSGNSFLFVGGG